MPKVSVENVKEVTYAVLRKFEVPDSSIEAIFDTIKYANCAGKSTHGVRRLPLYIKKIEAGCLNPKDEVKIVENHFAMAVLDANNGFGQVASKYAIDMAIEKAELYGIAAVGVRNSNNFGTAGYYGNYAVNHGMAAMIYANAAPAIAPTGGNKTIFGTNPICYAFPGAYNKAPIVFDMATTVVARSKIRMAAQNGDKIPTHWAIGPDGKVTDDPNEALKGSLLPIAGYKGYGLSMFVDLFAGLLTGAAFGGEVKPLSEAKMESRSGHLFIVIDVKRFLNEDNMNSQLDTFYRNVKACGSDGSVLFPGESSYDSIKQNQTYVVISQKELEDVNSLAENLNINSRLLDIEVF